MPVQDPMVKLPGTTPSSGGKWRAQISIDGKPRYLGTFETPEQAHAAYTTAKQLHKARARKKKGLTQNGDIQVNHIYVYQGGRGAGKALNGTRFLVCRFITEDTAGVKTLTPEGEPSGKERRVFIRFLDPSSGVQGPDISPEMTLADRLKAEMQRIQQQDPTDPILVVLQESLEHVQDENKQVQAAKQVEKILKGSLSIEETLRWLLPNVSDAVVSDFITLLLGRMTPSEGLRWLQRHTEINPHILQKVSL